MAIARTGYGSYNGTDSNYDNYPFDITVPENTDCLIVYVCGYSSSADVFTFTTGNVTCESATADAVISSSDASNSAYMGAGWVFLDPPTGAGVTIDFEWSTALGAGCHPLFVWVAYSGVGSIRGTYGDQEGAPDYETTTLTASSGDVISVAAFGYASSEASVTAWSNATEISEFSKNGSSDITIAEHSPSGNVIIATDGTSNYGDGGMMAVVMVPAAVAGGTTYMAWRRFNVLLRLCLSTITSLFGRLAYALR